MKKRENKEKDKNKKWRLIILLGLLFAISGLTLSFLTISKHIVIQAEQKVKPNPNDFKVQFSSHPYSIINAPIYPITYPVRLKATPGYISNKGNLVIYNLSAEFNNPGQSATYHFFAVNSGKYSAYLKKIDYTKLTGYETNKVCIAKDSNKQSLVDQACDGIKVIVKVGKENYTSNTINKIDNHILPKDSFENIYVTILYDDDAKKVDADFNVKFGEIHLIYSSVD